MVEGLLTGAIATVELERVGMTGTGIALARQVAGVVRVLDVPGDLPGPVAGNHNVDSAPGAERRQLGGVDISWTTDNGDWECEATMNSRI